MSVTTPISAGNRFTVQQLATSYMCRYCAKQFVSVRDMQLHVLQHSRGNAPLNCAICNKSYRTPSKLQRHVRVHSGERPYICNLCGRRFTRSDHLKQHMKVHSPNRQKNMCRLCNARFTSCHLLGSHLRTHEIHQIHLCRCCGEGFPTADELERHKRLHDVKGTIRATRGRRSAAHSMITDPTLDMVNPESGGSLHSERDSLNEKPNLHGSKWIGCARFCLSQIPAENSNSGAGGTDGGTGTITAATDNDGGGSKMNNNGKLHQTSDHELEPLNLNDDSGSSGIEIIAEDLSKTRHDGDETEDSRLDAGTRPKMVVSPLSNQPDSSPPTGLPRGYHETGLSIANNLSMLPLPSASCDDIYGPAAAAAAAAAANMMHYPTFKSSENLKALIKREPQSLEPHHNMSYTRNLLSVPSSLSRPLYAPSQYDPRLQFPHYLSPNYLEFMYNQNSQHSQRLTKLSPGTRCEHCHIWFEDSAMYMLHNSLHSADEADPFTCKKCMKKLGNRLEFTAHLVWHLDPIID